MRIGKDICTGAMLTEHIQDLLHVTPLLTAGIEFSITISTGTSLAEAVVALLIHQLGAGNQGQVLFPLMHILSPFQNHGLQTQFD